MEGGAISLVESFVFTQKAEDNQPWFTFIMKRQDPSKTAIVAKVDQFVLVLDPNALSRGSLWIRLYHEVNSLTEVMEDVYALQVYDLLHAVSSPLLVGSHDRIIYPESLADTINHFPMKDASYFAMAALNRAKEQLYGSDREPTPKERALQKEIDKLRYELGQKRARAKRRNHPQY